MFLAAFISFLICFHILWVSFQLLVHRSMMHGHYVIVNKKLENTLRFLLWLTMGLGFNNWAQHLTAQHRKHHLFTDTKDDPNSVAGVNFFQMFDYKHNEPGRLFYISPEDVKKYASDVKVYDGWVELNLYQKYPTLGLTILWIIYTLLFGIGGFVVGAVHRFLITEIIILIANYGTHNIGFRYVELPPGDRAVIMFPIAILLAGEELHANHHKYPKKLNYAIRWFEFDSGYWYAKIFVRLGLMKVV